MIDLSRQYSLTELHFVHSVVYHHLQVFAGDRQVQVKGLMLNDEVQIYNLAGSRLNDQKASTSTMTIPLAHGVYLLKAANQIYKVVIR
jgi:hypothetical protein